MLEIDAEAGEEQLVERVAAIDVAKASAVVCVRVAHASIAGRRVTRVWEVRSTTNAIIALAEQLAGERIERVVVESTSDYWRPFVYLLEAQGLTVWLVNASQVKQVPVRPKTDKLDAVWLAKLNERGMLRPSFVPPAEIRRLRDYTRLRVDLIADRTRQVQRLEKLLEDALIKLSTVVSDMRGFKTRFRFRMSAGAGSGSIGGCFFPSRISRSRRCCGCSCAATAASSPRTSSCWFCAISCWCFVGSSRGRRSERPIAPSSLRSAGCSRLEVGTG
jgi:hypothetical protein